MPKIIDTPIIVLDGPAHTEALYKALKSALIVLDGQIAQERYESIEELCNAISAEIGVMRCRALDDEIKLEAADTEHWRVS